jgi:DNA-binding transcriptional regulator YiaG
MSSSKQDTARSKTARGERVKSLREALGLTGKELADRLNMTAAQVGLPALYDAVAER